MSEMDSINLGTPAQIKVVLGNENFIMRKPKMQEAVDLDAAIKAADETSSVVVFSEFLDKLGFPKAKALELTTDQMNALVQGLMPKKKD